MASALLNPLVIDNYLQLEVQTGRVAGSFSKPPLPVLHVSRFRVNPKRHLPGKWHLILDLSSPAVHSVNDGIVGEDYSVQYMKVDDIIADIMQLGRGSLLAKFFVQNAYCIVPVHTEDRQLLGMKWCGAFYVDMVLPFSVMSAPYISTGIADFVEWGGQAKLRRHLPDVFPWWLSQSLPSQLLCLSTQSGQVYRIFF